jgi:hypothetical protein
MAEATPHGESSSRWRAIGECAVKELESQYSEGEIGSTSFKTAEVEDGVKCGEKTPRWQTLLSQVDGRTHGAGCIQLLRAVRAAAAEPREPAPRALLLALRLSPVVHEARLARAAPGRHLRELPATFNTQRRAVQAESNADDEVRSAVRLRANPVGLSQPLRPVQKQAAKTAEGYSDKLTTPSSVVAPERARKDPSHSRCPPRPPVRRDEY